MTRLRFLPALTCDSRGCTLAATTEKLNIFSTAIHMNEKIEAAYKGKWVTNIGAFMDRWRMRNMSPKFSDQAYSEFEEKTQKDFEVEMEKTLVRIQKKLVSDKG